MSEEPAEITDIETEALEPPEPEAPPAEAVLEVPLMTPPALAAQIVERAGELQWELELYAKLRLVAASDGETLPHGWQRILGRAIMGRHPATEAWAVVEDLLNRCSAADVAEKARILAAWQAKTVKAKCNRIGFLAEAVAQEVEA